MFYVCKTEKIHTDVLFKNVCNLFIIIDLQSERKIVIGLTEHKSWKTSLREKFILLFIYIYINYISVGNILKVGAVVLLGP